MYKSSKQQSVTQVKTSGTGGLNYVDAPGVMPDEDCQRLNNYLYDTNTQIPMTRPGSSCVTSSTLSSTSIRKIFPYIKSSTEEWLVGAIGNQLYYLTSTSAWSTTGVTLNDITTVPGMLVFNQKLLVADGGDIKTWDGSSAGILSGTGHPHATALAEIKGHVAANSLGDLDGVYFSAVEDETIWSDGTSEAVRAGYKDGMTVNALAVAPGGNDLLVSKKEDAKKMIYRVNVEDATSTNWYAVPVSINNAAQTNCLITAMNESYFADTNGFKTLRGVQEYGDLMVDFRGRKINNVFADELVINEVSFLPLYNSIWIFAANGRAFVYHPVNGAFTDVVFKAGQIMSACQLGTTVYLAGYNGFLYKLNEDVSTDEHPYGTTGSFESIFKTKQFTFPEAGVLRRVEAYLTPKLAGTLKLYASTPEHPELLLKTITLTDEGDFLYDATGKLYVATGEIYDAGSDPWFETSYGKTRSRGISFLLKTTSGRVGINQVEAEFGMVGGH